MLHRIQRVLFLASVFLVPALAQSQESQPEYSIRPGDQVDITFFTQAGDPLPAVMGPRFVDRTGNLYLPFVGSVQVQGLDTNGLRALLVERFAGFYDDPVVDVVVRLRVNVTGAVRVPNHYFLLPGANVVDALAIAGGTLAETGGGWGASASDPSRVRLVRGEEVITMDLRPDATADASRSMQILSGDWIHVPVQGRARLREDVMLASNILGAVGSLAALIILFSR